MTEEKDIKKNKLNICTKVIWCFSKIKTASMKSLKSDKVENVSLHHFFESRQTDPKSSSN